jgi:ferritin-like metal-binding protein YciE
MREARARGHPDRARPRDGSGAVSCAQAVEHYEIARYGSLVPWSTVKVLTDVAALLQQALDKEKRPIRCSASSGIVI